MKYRVTAGRTVRDFPDLKAAKQQLRKYTEGTIIEYYNAMYQFVRYELKNGRIIKI